MTKRLLALLLALASHAAFAAWDAVIPSGANTLEYVAGGVNVSNGPGTGSMFIGRNFSTPAGGSTAARSALAVETLGMNVGGNALQVVATRGIGMAALAEGALAVGAAAYVGAQIGAPISKMLGHTDVQIGNTRCIATNTGWQCDEGGASAVQTVLCAQPSSWPGQHCFGTSQDFANAWIAYIQSTKTYYCQTTATPPVTLYNTFTVNHLTATAVYLDQTNACTGAVTSFTSVGLTSSQASACPAYIDALNPAWSGHAGDPPNPDGKCRTGRYNAESDPFVKARIVGYGDPTAGPAMAQDLMDKGKTINGAEPISITGPASKPGTSTTSTTTSGTNTTTTTSTPTTNYTYSPTSITYNVTTTTTTNNNGTVTTTTGSSTPDQTDQCKANPTLLACMKSGDTPSDTVTPTKKDITFATEDLGFGGGCPAPYQMTFRGWTLALNYQPACNAAPLIRPGLIALTALSCLIMIVTVCGKP